MTIRLEQGTEPSIIHTSTLISRLVEKFKDDLGYFLSGEQLIVHATDTNLCQYSVSTLHGQGLQNNEVNKFFALMIRRKIKSRQSQEKMWAYTSEEVLESLIQVHGRQFKMLCLLQSIQTLKSMNTLLNHRQLQLHLIGRLCWLKTSQKSKQWQD